MKPKAKPQEQPKVTPKAATAKAKTATTPSEPDNTQVRAIFERHQGFLGGKLFWRTRGDSTWRPECAPPCWDHPAIEYRFEIHTPQSEIRNPVGRPKANRPVNLPRVSVETHQQIQAIALAKSLSLAESIEYAVRLATPMARGL